MAKKISIPCFSNGTEFALWMERNCDRCYKSPKTHTDQHDSLEYITKSRCAIWDEIGHQCFGSGDDPVSERTYNATQSLDCPYRKENWPKRNKVKKDKSLTIEF